MYRLPSKNKNSITWNPFFIFSFIIISLSLFLYIATYTLSYRYHQAVVPTGDPFTYTLHLFHLLDLSKEDYFLAVKSVFTDPVWYWLYKLPVAFLSPFLSKEPYSLSLVNYLFLAIATMSFCRLALRMNMGFNSTLILSFSLWLYPWVYGFQNPTSLFVLQLDTSFYWILISFTANLIIYALEPKKVTHALTAGIFSGLAIWGRGNSLPYVLIGLCVPMTLVIYKIIKTTGNKRKLVKSLIIFIATTGLFTFCYYFFNFKNIALYYSGYNQFQDLNRNFFSLLINEPQVTLRGMKYIILNFPGEIFSRQPYSFWGVFTTCLFHIFVILNLILTFQIWKRTPSKQNRLLLISSLSGALLYYGNLFMMVFLFSNYWADTKDIVYHPFIMMLIGIIFSMLSPLVGIFRNKSINRWTNNPYVFPLLIAFLISYGYFFSKQFSRFQTTPDTAQAKDVQSFSLDLNKLTEEKPTSFLWYGLYNPAIVNYYRVKNDQPGINMYRESLQGLSLYWPIYGDLDKTLPIGKFRKLLKNIISKSNYLIIPENISDFDLMLGGTALVARRKELADILNSPDSPKYVVKMILHDYKKTRLLLLKRLRRGENPKNLDLLKLPYGNKNAVYPQNYPKAGSDIYQPETRIPFGPRYLFDNSLHTFWETQGSIPMKERVEIQFGIKRTVSGYIFNIGPHLPEAIGRMPISWKLQASNDGHNWKIVDERTNFTKWNPKQKKTFWIKNPDKYYIYRFVFTRGGEVHGNGYILRIYEIELLQKDFDDKTSKIDNSHFDWH